MGFLSFLFSSEPKKTRVSDYLPYEELYADGDILTKDWGLMRCYRVTYPDTSTSDMEAGRVSELVSQMYRSFSLFKSEGRAAYWFITLRVPRSLRIDPRFSGAMNMTDADREIEDERVSVFSDSDKNNENVTYACCKVSPMRPDASNGGLSQRSRNRAESVFRQFEAMLGTIGAHPRKLTTDDTDPDTNIMSFLKHVTGPDTGEFRCPRNGMGKLSSFISALPLENGRPMKLGEKYIQNLTINAFPSETYPDILVALETLPFCFRWTTRWLPLCNYDSQEEAKKMRTNFRTGTKSMKTMVYEAATGNETDVTETQAVVDVGDMEEVLIDLSHGETLGRLTSVITLTADSIEELDREKKMVKMCINHEGFDFIEEGPESNFAAWLSSLPGDSSSNPRQPFVTSANLSHIVPFTDVYHGSDVNEFMKRICGNGFPHAIGKLVTNEPFYLNLNGRSGDTGHTMIIGETGSGKSVMLSFLASQWMRYPGSRVILFDKDLSFEPICRSTGGSIYTPLGEDDSTQFMPLSRMVEHTHSDEVLTWLECLLEAQNIPYDAAVSKDFDDIIHSWGNLPPTLENFYTQLRGYNPSSPALPAIRRVIDDPGLSRLFGGTEDSFSRKSFTRKTMIEMGPLMNRGTIAILPALQFIFSRMDNLFDSDPKPTLLIMDEAWRFMMHRFFRTKIKEWLKTLRKKNVFVIFAFQNIGDIDDIEEFLTSCHTVIYLPNRNARPDGSAAIREKYSRLGLKDGEIDVIGNATEKKHYYIRQDEGSALVDFCIDQFQLERITRRGF